MDYLSSAKLLEYSRKLKDVMYSKEEIDELFALSNEGFQSAITNLTEQFNDALVHITVDEENETLVIENGAPLIDVDEVIGITTVNTYAVLGEFAPETLFEHRYADVLLVEEYPDDIIPVTDYEEVTEEGGS